MRAALPRTWYPFFARFPRPYAVQLEVWQPLLDGADCLVCSPAATGKTEAVVAPLTERILQDATARSPKLLLVSPTRALVNDLVRRLSAPLERLGLRIHRRTGDHAQLDRSDPPDLLVTTPESLDSLLVRHTAHLRHVRAVVLDELHILDGTVRGDQLQALLWRLRAITERSGDALQTVASSATVHDPDGMAERYLRQGRSIVVPGSKRLAVRYAHCPNPLSLVSTLASVWGTGPSQARKVLVFVSSRAEAEDLASRAHHDRRLGNRVYAHHGSLSREERERVESRFASDPSALCFATMTLELGIDIGDVDLVALVGPPGSVASFVQRVGRGNRRSEFAELLACCRSRGEEARFRHLAALAEHLDLCVPPYRFRPSVLVQQIGSLLLQSSQQWLTPKVLRSRLPPSVATAYNEEQLRELMQHLVRERWLRPARLGRFDAGPLLTEAFERRHLHANLAGEAPTLEVVEHVTGRRLGYVQAREDQPERLTLGGRSRDVLGYGNGQIRVQQTGGEAEPSRFVPTGQNVMSFEMARSLALYIGLEDDEIPVLRTDRGTTILHCLGSIAGELLARHLRHALGWPVARCSTLALHLDGLPPAETPPAVRSSELNAEIPAIGGRLARLAAAGRHHRRLPETWQHAWLRSFIPTEQIAVVWSSGRFTMPTDDQQLEVLLDLADA